MDISKLTGFKSTILTLSYNNKHFFMLEVDYKLPFFTVSAVSQILRIKIIIVSFYLWKVQQ